jgi:SOS-response transcriptional repressor LexA
MGLTKQQAAVLQCLRTHLAQSGVCPSYREMADELGLASAGSLHRTMQRLEERGYIRRLANRARAIEICEPKRSISLNPEISALLEQYAQAHEIEPSVAGNELLRSALGAA